MTMEIGIAGWAINRSIREHKTMTLMDLPKLARQEFNVDTIELVSTFFESQNAKYLNEVRQTIERERLRIANIAVDTGNLSSPDEATRRTDIETIKQWFHVARALGSAAIRVNTGDATPDDKAALERIVAGYQELVEHAQQSGVKLLIENHGGVSADPANIETILKRLDTPWFATCPDVNNFVGDTWDEGMRLMAPRAFALHIKNWSYDPDGWQTKKNRDGSTARYNLKDCLRIMKEAGFQGPYNFENNLAEEDEVEGIRKGIAYTRQLMASL
jgi:sugar phosphate isomerase/epimerase